MSDFNLDSQLWNMANLLRGRGKMEPSEYKDYILGLLCYCFLSEECQKIVNEDLKSDGLTYVDLLDKSEDDEDIQKFSKDCKEKIGYFIKPVYSWGILIQEIKKGTFQFTKLQEALNNFDENVSDDLYKKLFENIDLYNNKMGNKEDKNSLLQEVMVCIEDNIIQKIKSKKEDILSYVYEYFLNFFATEVGKKAGEFYTPPQISKLLAKLVSCNYSHIKKIYDPTCGSGSLLLKLNKEIQQKYGEDKEKTPLIKIYGQEKIQTTFNLTKMNMILNKIKHDNLFLYNEDTLNRPNEDYLKERFEAIVANPPYSLQWDSSNIKHDERFHNYGGLAPKNKADLAFVQHMLFLLADNGMLAVVLPHGILFRGNAEEKIRQNFLDQNLLDAVIGLPSDLFYGTSIATCILIFKKCRDFKDQDHILFIDASNQYVSDKKKNLSEEHINEIVATYIKKKEKKGYSALISLQDIKKNNYNLNISTYISDEEEDIIEEVDLNQCQDNIEAKRKKIQELDYQINNLMKELIN